jgi:hypothetical protein
VLWIRVVFFGNIWRKNVHCKERNNLIKDTETNLKYLKDTNRLICIGEVARFIKAGNSKSQILNLRLTTDQCLSKIVTILITGVANIINHNLRARWKPNCECSGCHVFGKDYRQYYDIKHRYMRSGCNVISCKLKIENMVYREQRLRGKFGIVWKTAVRSDQRIKGHFKLYCGNLKWIKLV